jgi:hypothetical protein
MTTRNDSPVSRIEPIAHLITDGSLGGLTNAVIVERAEDLHAMAVWFSKETHTPLDEVVVNPVLAPIFVTGGST